MIDYNTYCKIRCLKAEGLSFEKIAKQVGRDPKTVGKWAKKPRYEQRQQRPQASKLDRYKDEIIRLLEHHDLSGEQIYQRLKKAGYTGRRTILRNYIQKVRPRRKPAYLTLKFSPGECAQVDWGEYGKVAVGNTMRRLSFFVMVLCYSRMLFLRFTLGQGMEHFLKCHEEAFHCFGGVPHRIMVDNLKCAVLRRNVGNAPVYNPRYADYARHYHFAISACNVRKGNEKGQVESAVGYVKKNLLRGLEISKYEILAPLAQEWLDQVANVRLHGTLKKRPVDLFAEDKQAMKPLPPLPMDTGRLCPARANSRFRVLFDANRYSVPYRYASKPVRMYVYTDELHFYDGDKLIARHPRCYDRNQDFEHPDHVAGLLAKKGKALYQRLLTAFLDLAPCAPAFYEQLKLRNQNERYHVRQIMALRDQYGEEMICRVLADCHAYQVYNASYVANLLEQRTRITQEPGPLHLSRREDLLDLELPKPDLDVYETFSSPDFPADPQPPKGE